jgi:hypothetical protein
MVAADKTIEPISFICRLQRQHSFKTSWSYLKLRCQWKRRNIIMVERAMYWNNKGAGTYTIGGYSD